MPREYRRILVLDDSNEYRNKFVEAINHGSSGGLGESSRDGALIHFVAEGVQSLNAAMAKLRTSLQSDAAYFCVIVDQYWDQTEDMFFGFEATQKLREIKPDLVVVIYSNRLDFTENFKERAYGAGAVRYLPKPQGTSDMGIAGKQLLHTLRELADIRSALEEHQRIQRKLAVLTLTIPVGQAIIDRENIVWFISDAYEKLIPGKAGRLGVEGPLPGRMDVTHVSGNCREMMQSCLAGETDQNQSEATEFLPDPQPNGTFIKVAISPFGQDGDGRPLAVNKIITGVSAEVLDVKYRAECILRSIHLPRAWVLKAVDKRTHFECVTAVTRQSSSTVSTTLPSKVFVAATGSYLELASRLTLPALFRGDEFPRSEFDREFGVRWPKLSAPLRVGDTLVGILFADSCGGHSLAEADCERAALFLPALAALLQKPAHLADKWAHWQNRLAQTRLDLLRAQDLDLFYQNITKAVAETTDSEMAHLRVPEGGDLILKGVVGRFGEAAKSQTGTRHKISQDSQHSFSARVFRSKVPMYREDFQKAFQNETIPVASQWSVEEREAFVGIQTAVHLPLVHNVECYGTIALHSSKPGHYSGKQEFLSDLAAEAAAYISSGVLASRVMQSANIAQSRQKDNLHKLAQRMQRIEDEDNLLWHFAVGMTHGDVVGFNRVILGEFRRQPPFHFVVRLAVGPKDKQEGGKFREDWESQKLRVDLWAATERWAQSGHHYPSSSIMDRFSGEKLLFSEVPSHWNTLSEIIPTSVDELPPPLAQMLSQMDVTKAYRFQLTLDPERVLVGLCDFVYHELYDLDLTVLLANELIGHLELALARQRLEHQAAEQVWRRFVGLASHRMLSLIPPILDQAKFASEDLLNSLIPSARTRLEVISKAAKAAYDLLGEFTKYTHTRVKPDARMSVSEFATWLEKEVEDLFPRVTVSFKRLCLSESAHVMVDKAHFRDSIIELIQDSLKYGRVDARELAISLSFNCEKSFRLIYEDNGPGIPSEMHATLFEPFAAESVVKGTGLGLAIVKSTVSQHRGRITEQGDRSAAPPPERWQYPSGVCFVIELPILN